MKTSNNYVQQGNITAEATSVLYELDKKSERVT